MKSKPILFTASRLIIEEQLLKIASRLKNIDGATNNDFSAIYRECKSVLQSIDKYNVRLKSIVLSALVEYEPSVVYAFADNHLPHEILGLKILEIAEELLLSVSSTEKSTTIASLIHHYNKYDIAIHENMYREEATLLPLLKRYYSEEELLALQAKVEKELSIKRINSLIAANAG